jgi:hypothetical protein
MFAKKAVVVQQSSKSIQPLSHASMASSASSSSMPVKPPPPAVPRFPFVTAIVTVERVFVGGTRLVLGLSCCCSDEDVEVELKAQVKALNVFFFDSMMASSSELPFDKVLAFAVALMRSQGFHSPITEFKPLPTALLDDSSRSKKFLFERALTANELEERLQPKAPSAPPTDDEPDGPTPF